MPLGPGRGGKQAIQKKGKTSDNIRRERHHATKKDENAIKGSTVSACRARNKEERTKREREREGDRCTILPQAGGSTHYTSSLASDHPTARYQVPATISFVPTSGLFCFHPSHRIQMCSHFPFLTQSEFEDACQALCTSASIRLLTKVNPFLVFILFHRRYWILDTGY
jgi:hypothetical protein